MLVNGVDTSDTYVIVPVSVYASYGSGAALFLTSIKCVYLNLLSAYALVTASF